MEFTNAAVKFDFNALVLEFFTFFEDNVYFAYYIFVCLIGVYGKNWQQDFFAV